MYFEDSFDYPDGPLDGQGPWGLDTIGDPTCILITHRVTNSATPAVEGNSADAFGVIDTNDPWFIEVDFVINHGATPSVNQVEIYWADLNFSGGPLLALEGGTFAGGHNLHVNIQDAVGATADAFLTLADPTAVQTARLRRDGADLVASVNGADVATIPGADFAQSTVLLQLLVLTNALQPRPFVHRVATGIT